MSDFEDQGLFSDGEPMDTTSSEDNISKDVLEEETDLLVSISQSSDLQSESKGVKVDSESQDSNSKVEKSDRFQVPESKAKVREAHSLPESQKSIHWIDIMDEVEQNPSHSGESFGNHQDLVG